MPTTRRLKGCTIAALAADGFEKVELIVPLRALKTTGAKVDVVSLRRGRIRGVPLTSWPGIRDDLVSGCHLARSGARPGREPHHEQRAPGHGRLRPRNDRCLRGDLAGAGDVRTPS